jgi:hypothetical protein
MGLLDELLGIKPEPKKKKGWDFSVFDNDRFKNDNSSNWVDWEDVSTGDVDTDGYEHPYYDDKGEW